VQLDEIHIRTSVTCKNGKLTGVNDEGEIATSIHCFMISSLLSKNKDVAALVPETLSILLKSVIKTVTLSGYSIIIVITDGNRINKKCFIYLLDVLLPLTSQLMSQIRTIKNDQFSCFLIQFIF